MIKNNENDILVIEGEDGAELEVEKYVIKYPKSKLNNYKDGKLYISINQCESVVLNKEDALSVVNRILELLD